jgi:hypothetical protein
VETAEKWLAPILNYEPSADDTPPPALRAAS